jgi:hypothetical protein
MEWGSKDILIDQNMDGKDIHITGTKIHVCLFVSSEIYSTYHINIYVFYLESIKV